MIKMRDLLNEIIDLSKYNIDEIVEDNIQSGQSVDVVKKHLIDFVKILERLPSKVTLFRVLNIENNVKINTTQLGTHFTLDVNFSNDFLQSIGLESASRNDLKIVSVQTSKSNIKIGRTLAQNVIFPNEREIFIQPNSTFSNIKIQLYSK